MRKGPFGFFLVFLFILSIGQALEEKEHPFLKLEPKTQQEALFLRRIVEFWEEKSYELAEAQILAFLTEFPQSEMKDPLHALLGDLYVYRKDIGRALQAYSKIVSEEIHEQVLLSELQCLHAVERYTELTKIAEPFMEQYMHSKKEKSLDILFLVADSHYRLASSHQEKEVAKYEAEQAQKYFEKLLTTDRSALALEPLAFLHHFLGENERAADLYVMAAQANPSEKEKFLFKAANLQATFDKETALETFAKVTRMHKAHASKAAFNRMVLLFDTKKFEDLVLAKDQIQRQIPKDALPLFHFFLGRSYYEMQDHKRATQELSLFVEEELEKTPERKVALLTLIECARIQKNFPIFDAHLSFLEKEYPESSEIPEAVFVRAMMNKEQDYLEDARRDLERLVRDFPDYSNRSFVQYEYAKVLFDVEDFALSREKFKELIEAHPDHSMKALAWHYFIQSSISLTHFDRSKNGFVKDQLAFDLELFLQQEDLLSEQEKSEYELLLARTNYEIQAYEEAIDLLETFLAQDVRKDLASEGYLILAYCYRKGMHDLEKFCAYAEESLAIATSTTDSTQLHIGLFNTYLERSKTDPSKRDIFVEQAADHLYIAQKKGAQIKQKNQIWLADYYYNKVKECAKELAPSKKNLYMARSIEVFEKAFQTSSVQLIILDDKTVSYVPYILKLADLYAMQGQYEKKREILAQLHSQYVLRPNLKWVQVDEIFYELAKEYAKLPDKVQEALSLYESILERSPSLQKYVSASSCLSSARLRYQDLEEKTDRKDPCLQKILTQLKSLSIQRDLENEPIHLEATLDYIAIHCHTESEELRLQKRLELLTNAKESFEQAEDVLARDYHLKREQIPEKNQLFSLYMTFFAAEIDYCKSRLANKESRLEDEKYYGEQANRLYLQLKEEKDLTQYLQKRVEYRLQSTQENVIGEIF